MRTNRGKGPVFLFLLILLAFSASAQEKIEWESVAGADHYLVEVRQQGRLVFETRSEVSSIPLFLPPGDYDFQIKVVDAFGNIRTVGESSRLSISAPLTPFIVDVSPRIIHEDAEPLFFARVSGLVDREEQSTTFALENAKGEKLRLSWETSDSAAEGWIEIALSGGKKLPGADIWHLIMTNPDGREDRFEDALTISQGSRPRIISVNPREFTTGIPNAVLRIRARDFSGDATLLMDGPSEIPIAKLNQGEEGVFEFSLNLREASEGQYSLSLLNPSGEIDTGIRRLRIHSLKTASSGKALEIDEKEPRSLSEYPNAIYGGWKPIIRLGDTGIEFGSVYPGPLSENIVSDVVFQPGFLGFSLGYSRDIENDLLRRLPYLDGLEWHLSASYAQSKLIEVLEIFNNEIEVQRHHSLAFLLGISYTTWFDFPLNFLAQIGFGVGLTLRDYIGSGSGSNDGNSGPDSNINNPNRPPPEYINPALLYPKNSISFAMSFDLGLRWDITRRFFVNATANAMMKSSIDGYNEFSIQPKIEGGWRW